MYLTEVPGADYDGKYCERNQVFFHNTICVAFFKSYSNDLIFKCDERINVMLLLLLLLLFITV